MPWMHAYLEQEPADETCPGSNSTELVGITCLHDLGIQPLFVVMFIATLVLLAHLVRPSWITDVASLVGMAPAPPPDETQATSLESTFSGPEAGVAANTGEILPRPP